VIWFVFDMAGFPEPLHASLARAFARSSRRDGSPEDSHFYAASPEIGVSPSTYFLSVSDDLAFTRLIRQFGGRRCARPSSDHLWEIQQDDDLLVVGRQ
jgi:hypothetical protein